MKTIKKSKAVKAFALKDKYGIVITQLWHERLFAEHWRDAFCKKNKVVQVEIKEVK